MRYLSVCSGIEAATVAWHPLGWEPVAFSEVEPFPCAVLAHHYPHVPNLGDMTKIDGSKYHEAVELVVGGTPCQDFSVAGKRAGMEGERGALALAYIDLLERIRPRWVVWENVPGVLSTNEGRDFGSFLGGLAKLGYGFAYRILDAQYGYRGDWRPAAAVLFEPHSLCGHSAPRRKKTADIAGAIAASSYTGGAAVNHFVPHVTQALTGSLGAGGADDNRAQAGFYVPVPETAGTMKSMGGKTGSWINNVEMAAGGYMLPYIPKIVEYQTDLAYCLANPGSGGRTHSRQIMTPEMRVRRLTPKECERLQGFPDNYTVVPYRAPFAALPKHILERSYHRYLRRMNRQRKHALPLDELVRCVDRPRYKALGNSMAVPVMRWIGERIEAVERSLPAGWPHD